MKTREYKVKVLMLTKEKTPLDVLRIKFAKSKTDFDEPIKLKSKAF